MVVGECLGVCVESGGLEPPCCAGGRSDRGPRDAAFKRKFWIFLAIYQAWRDRCHSISIGGNCCCISIRHYNSVSTRARGEVVRKSLLSREKARCSVPD